MTQEQQEKHHVAMRTRAHIEQLEDLLEGRASIGPPKTWKRKISMAHVRRNYLNDLDASMARLQELNAELPKEHQVPYRERDHEALGGEDV